MTIRKVDESTIEISQPVVKLEIQLDELVRNREIVAQKLASIDAQIAEAKALGVKETKDIVAVEEVAIPDEIK